MQRPERDEPAGDVEDFRDADLETSVSTASGDSSGPQKRRFWRASPPIIVVIMMATFISTASSMAGGLIMYYQSLDSLEDTVKETSESEMRGLEDGVIRILNSTTGATEQMKSFFFNTERIYGNSSEDWGNISRALSFALGKGSAELYGAGVVLIPYDVTNSNAFYSAVWADPLKNGAKEAVHAVYGNFLPSETYFPTEGGNLINMTVKTSKMNQHTGYVEEFAYDWDGRSYLTDMLGDWDPRDGGLPTTSSSWQEGSYTAVASKWRPPRSWQSSDDTAYTYSSYDTAYVPPPPPHPWSSFKAVLFVSQYLYSSWEEGIVTYKQTRPDTTVVIVDSVTRIIYAATTGQKMVDQLCAEGSGFNVSQPLSCATTVSDMSSAIQQGIEELLSAPPGTFLKRELDGEDHFLRKSHLHEDVVVIWMRPVSSVQGKVQEALTLLIIFTVLVLAFDATISVLEIWFIAMPLQRLSSAIQSVGRMDTDDAAGHVKRYDSARVMVREMRTLMEGMGTTVSRLAEYKAFMPEAVLQGSDGPGVDPPEGDVSLVFTDIVRSTELWEAVPEAMAVAMDLHNKAMRRCIQSNGGYEVKTIGDAFMVAFQSPADAVSFACDVQAALVQEAWPDDLLHFTQSEMVQIKGDTVYCGLRVRMGAHFGHAEIEINPLTERADYRGSTVNKAARIEAQALPGMLALSSELHDAIKSKRSDGDKKRFTMHSLGKRNLKGIGEATLYYALPEALKHRAQCYKDFTRPALPKPEMLVAQHRRRAGDDVSEGGKSPVSQRSTVIISNKEPGFERRLRRSECAFAMVRMGRVAEAALLSDEGPQVLSVLNQSFQVLLDYANMTEGKLECFNGTSLTISWNCAGKCASFMMQSLRFCGLLQRRKVQVQVGVACGQLFHGFTGSSIRKYHTVLGPSVRYAEILADLCGQYESSAMFIASGGVQPQFAHCCVPVDVWEGQRGFEPLIIVEDLKGPECAELRSSWEDHVGASSSSPHGCQLRSALLKCATGDTRAPLEDMMSDSQDHEAPVYASLERLLRKPVLVTPASALPLLPTGPVFTTNPDSALKENPRSNATAAAVTHSPLIRMNSSPRLNNPLKII